jgi:hypothetical protein
MTDKNPTLPASEFAGKDHAIDFSIEDCKLGSRDWIKHGYDCYQKFTCEQCGRRLMVHEKNTYDMASCAECGALTDIRARGCNYICIRPEPYHPKGKANV